MPNAALLGGLLEGFGASQAQAQARQFQADQTAKAQRLSILQAAATNPNLNPADLPGILQQMTEIYPPGGKGAKRGNVGGAIHGLLGGLFGGGGAQAAGASRQTPTPPQAPPSTAAPSAPSAPSAPAAGGAPGVPAPTPAAPPAPPNVLNRAVSGIEGAAHGLGARLQRGIQGARAGFQGGGQAAPPLPPMEFLTPAQQGARAAEVTGAQTQAAFQQKQAQLNQVIADAQAKFPNDPIRQQEYVSALVPGYKFLADRLVAQPGKIDAKDINPNDINLATGTPIGSNPPPGVYQRLVDPQTGQTFVQRQSEQASAALITLQDKQRYTGLLLDQQLGRPISPQDQAWMNAYKQTATMVSVEGAKARENLYLQSRVYGVLDRSTNQLTMASARDIASNPDRFAPASQQVAANNRMALVQSLYDQSQQVRKDLGELPTTFSAAFRSQMSLAAKAAADGNAGMFQSIVQGAARSGMSPQEQAYVIDLTQLAEDSMGLRQILGVGGVSDLVRSAILNVIPSASTPSREYALRQLDQLDAVIGRVSRGIPQTELPEPPASLGGAARPDSSPSASPQTPTIKTTNPKAYQWLQGIGVHHGQ